eukprot:5962022-Pyramimonas_sp.AAC.1
MGNRRRRPGPCRRASRSSDLRPSAGCRTPHASGSAPGATGTPPPRAAATRRSLPPAHACGQPSR